MSRGYFKEYTFKVKGGKYPKVVFIATSDEMANEKLIEYCIKKNCEPDDRAFDKALNEMLQNK